MALATVTTTFDVHDLFGADFDSRRTKAWATTNAPDDVIHDTSTGETRIGGAYATVGADGTGSFTHWAPGADGNPLTWQTYYHFSVPDRTFGNGRRTETFGPFTVTTSGELTDLVEEQIAVPTAVASDYADAAGVSATDAAASAADAATSATDAQTAETNAETAQGAAEAARDAAIDISGLATSDAVVEALVKNTGGAGPLTSAAVDVAIGAASGTPVDALVTWGDSLTADANATAPTWTDELGTELGITASNQGHGGSASDDIAMWQGGLDPLISVTANTIPTSGAVTATLPDSTYSFREQSLNAPSNQYQWTGYIEDTTGTQTPGTLTHTQLISGAVTWSFTRTTPGTAVTLHTGAFFHCTDGDTHRNDIQVLWVGRNNVYSDVGEGVTLNDVPATLDRMIRHLPIGNQRYLVLGPPAAPEDVINSTRWTALDQCNSILSRRYGTRYVDIWRTLVQRGMLLAGLAPTAADRTAIANDTVPPSLQQSGGGVHYNEYGSDVVKAVVREKLKELGYVLGARPQVTRLVRPGQPAASGTPGTSTATVIGTCGSNAVAAALYYRIQGSGAAYQATYALPSAGALSFSLTDLTPGSTYEMYVVSSTVLYDSAASQSNTFATAGTPPTVVTSDRFSGATAGSSLSGRSTDNGLGGSTKTWTASGVGVDADAYAYNLNTGSRIATLDTALTDFGVTVKVVALANVAASMSVRGRYADGNNYYGVNIGQTGAFTLIKRVTSTNTTLASGGAIAPGQTLKLSIVGTAIKVYVDGVQVMSVTDSALSAGTNLNLSFPSGDTGGRLDDLVVSSF